MTYAPLPLPILILCIISFCMYLYKHRSKSVCDNQRFSVSDYDYYDVRQVIAEHEGWKSEQFDVSVLDQDKAEVSQRCELGYPVRLSGTDGLYDLIIDGVKITGILILRSTGFRHVLDNNMPYEAYITGRDVGPTGLYDFFTITAYYR